MVHMKTLSIGPSLNYFYRISASFFLLCSMNVCVFEKVQKSSFQPPFSQGSLHHHRHNTIIAPLNLKPMLVDEWTNMMSLNTL